MLLIIVGFIIVVDGLFNYVENNLDDIPETVETAIKYDLRVRVAITGLLLTEKIAYVSVIWYREIFSEVMSAETYKCEKTSCCCA